MKRILLFVAFIVISLGSLFGYAQIFGPNCADKCKSGLDNCRVACLQKSFSKKSYRSCEEKCEDDWRACRIKC